LPLVLYNNKANHSGLSIDQNIVELLMKTQSEKVVELCCLILDKIYVDLDLDSLAMALEGPSSVQAVALRSLLKNDGLMIKVLLVNPGNPNTIRG
jgi:hypothetical protein